ncbi:MAG: class I tRNA ligase family protein, partial [Planctomycetes bacterium]|nr:class I tRNA ligase family protein [Planctomycetota bacterium]
RMEDWLRNMGDWCISRKRFWGLPLPFYKCGCGELTVVGSRSELAERAAGRLPELPELHRPWIDEVRIRCPKCSATVERIPEVGDCWLDAGIIPFSTLKYLEDPPYWREWFPAHMVCEMREQVRLWFYSLLFMSVTLEGKAPYETVLTYESVVDEEGARFSKTKGNAVWFDVAVEKIGADVMRWMYAAQPITSNLRFGEGPAQEVARKLLTFWNVYAFFVTYASLDRPDLSRPVDPHAAGLLDRWILARTDLLVRAARGRLDDYDTPAFVREAERFFDDLSNWYVRRSRRRFWKSGGDDAAAAYSTLYEVLLVTVRLLAPVVPFLAEHIWTNLTRARPGLPESVHLADYPAPDGAWRDDRLVADMATAQRLAALGLAARNEAGIKVRRPLSRMLARVEDSAERAACERLTSVVADEVNVKGIKFEDDLSGFLSYEVKPDFKALGPRLGSAVKEVAAALKSADSGALGPRVERGETIEVDTVSGPVRLAPPELVLKRGYRPGFAGAADRTLAVVLDTRIDHALLLEGLAREVVRLVQNMRKEAGFAVSDRIHAAWKAEGEVALAIQNHRDFIARETLSLALEPADEPRGDRVERFDLDGQPVTIAVRRT